MSKIVFLDVDGTLIDYEAKLPASATKAVDNLLVTARPLPSYIQTHERSSPFPCQYSRSTWIPRLKEDMTSPLRGVYRRPIVLIKASANKLWLT